MAITALPTPPSRQDPTNFNDRADSFLGALPAFATEANALQANVNTSEANAVASAAAVLAATNIVKWVSGTTYANGAVVWSPINGLAYRRITTSGSGTTDPSLDTTNYKQVNGTGDVGTSGNQTIAGTKTFSSTIIGDISGSAARLNGQLPSYYQTALGFTPVQQGTGTGQLSNVVKIGWNGSRIALEVDGTNFGSKWPMDIDGRAYFTTAAGDAYFTSTANASSGYGTNNSTYYKIGGRIITAGSGTIRLKVIIYSSVDSSSYNTAQGYYRILKNGVVVTGDYTVNTSPGIATWFTDHSCSPGDSFELYGRPQASGYAVSGYLSSGFSGYTAVAPALAYST
jgi:hypothetical protein